MEAVAYRSIVVRIWGRRGTTARVLLEEVQSGRRSELRGERASNLLAVLDAALPPEPSGAIVGVPIETAEGRGDRR